MGANKTFTSFLEIPKQKVYKPLVRFYKLVFYKKFHAFKNSCMKLFLKEAFMADSETFQHSIKLILHVKQGVFLLEKQVNVELGVSGKPHQSRIGFGIECKFKGKRNQNTIPIIYLNVTLIKVGEESWFGPELQCHPYLNYLKANIKWAWSCRPNRITSGLCVLRKRRVPHRMLVEFTPLWYFYIISCNHSSLARSHVVSTKRTILSPFTKEYRVLSTLSGIR